MNNLKFLLFIIFCVFGCKGKFTPPEVSTNAVNYITHNSAWIDCSVLTFGDSNRDLSNVGVCLNTTGNPSILDIKISDSRYNNTKVFSDYTTFLSGLSPNTTYYVRAFIEEGVDLGKIRSVAYGGIISFTTKNIDSIIDARDGQSYKIVQIGNQTWMAENLRYKTEAGFYEYNNEDNRKIYGLLYSYDGGNCACPKGWHLPSDAEWQVLEKELGMPEDKLNNLTLRGEDVAMKLKEPGRVNWDNSNFSTNESGFTALPGGVFLAASLKDSSEFREIGFSSYFLTSTLYKDSSRFYVRLLYRADIDRIVLEKNYGLSVRCVKD